MKRIFPAGTPHEQIAAAVVRMLKHAPAKTLAVTVEEWRRPRTNQQNAYLWGVVYPAVLEAGGEALGGWTRDDLHEFFLGECFGWETLEGFGRKRLRPLRRSSGMDKQTFTDYLMFVEGKCAQMGIFIPQPTYEG